MAWTGPDLAWAGRIWPGLVPTGGLGRAWVRRAPGAAPGCAPECVGWVADRRASVGLLIGGEKGKRGGKEEKEEGREREKKREVRERERRERGKRKFRVCSGFSEVETRLYSVRVFRKTRKITDLTF